jgi:hypothetical protein
MLIGFGVTLLAALSVATTALLAISTLSASMEDLLGTRIPQLKIVSKSGSQGPEPSAGSER